MWFGACFLTWIPAGIYGGSWRSEQGLSPPALPLWLDKEEKTVLNHVNPSAGELLAVSGSVTLAQGEVFHAQPGGVTQGMCQWDMELGVQVCPHP